LVVHGSSRVQAAKRCCSDIGDDLTGELLLSSVFPSSGVGKRQKSLPMCASSGDNSKLQSDGRYRAPSKLSSANLSSRVQAVTCLSTGDDWSLPMHFLPSSGVGRRHMSLHFSVSSAAKSTVQSAACCHGKPKPRSASLSGVIRSASESSEMESRCAGHRPSRCLQLASGELQALEPALKGDRLALGQSSKSSILPEPGVLAPEFRWRGVVSWLTAGLDSALQHSDMTSGELATAARELSGMVVSVPPCLRIWRMWRCKLTKKNYDIVSN